MAPVGIERFGCLCKMLCSTRPDMRNLKDLQAPAGRIDLCTKQGRNGLAIEKGRHGSQIY